MEQSCSQEDGEEPDLDPRIQVELEKLNNATDEINKLEIELDEANTAFRLLLSDSTRRLKLLSRKLGGCIERARPYYEALEVARHAQLECQRAAVHFQRANEIHQAAKETVALAEQRFLSKQHEWQFDNAWQEMLNHATIKVRDAEDQKVESGRSHQKRAMLFNAAEQKAQQLEQRLRRSVAKARPYFEEKALCQQQLATQKERVEALQGAVAATKASYSASLRQLERISEEIHCRRGALRGPREPGVGAELSSFEEPGPRLLASYERELDRCDVPSAGHSSSVSEKDDGEPPEEDDVEELRARVRRLAVRPVEGEEGRCAWESQLSASVDELDQALLLRECARGLEAMGSCDQ
ncbi:SH3 domain-binding protein 5 homolog [Bacillus rossius redtenbacheri]|uniref:SH3 domain-binding protein 5 homolog n=1 Tax=Bacillus rossius redtenbacheri TaxID=93214 RepID=UPI002FDDAB9A